MVAWPAISEVTCSEWDSVLAVKSTFELIPQTLVVDPPLLLSFCKLPIFEVV